MKRETAPKQEQVKSLSNTYVNKSRVVGFCFCHKVCLTAKQLKSRECLNKQCRYLIKYEKHQFWVERDRKKQLKNDSNRNN